MFRRLRPAASEGSEGVVEIIRTDLLTLLSSVKNPTGSGMD
jgi:hypothetical protein